MTEREKWAAAVDEIVRRAVGGEEQATAFLEALVAAMRRAGAHDFSITVHQGRWTRADHRGPKERIA